MRLVIALIPKEKTAFFGMRCPRSHSIDLGSPQFALITPLTGSWGRGRRVLRISYLQFPVVKE